MKLLLLVVIQSICTVGGMGLIGVAVGGKPTQPTVLFHALVSPIGLAGAVLLLASFGLTSIILSFTRLVVYVPLSTAVIFLFTLLYSVLVHGQRPSLTTTLGMFLILLGIAMVSRQSG